MTDEKCGYHHEGYCLKGLLGTPCEVRECVAHTTDDVIQGVTPELDAKIEKARQELKEGKAISLKTHEDVDHYFDSQ